MKQNREANKTAFRFFYYKWQSHELVREERLAFIYLIV